MCDNWDFDRHIWHACAQEECRPLILNRTELLLVLFFCHKCEGTFLGKGSHEDSGPTKQDP